MWNVLMNNPSNELRGQKLDMVVFDEIADITAVQEKAMSDMVDAMTYNLWGTTTGRIWTQPERICSFCKVYKQHHYKTEAGGHPFFHNNLEYLEWVAEKHV
jgi:hypothetical protein